MKLAGIINIHPHKIEKISKGHFAIEKTQFEDSKYDIFTVAFDVSTNNYPNIPNDSLVELNLKAGTGTDNFEVLSVGTWGNINQYTDQIKFAVTRYNTQAMLMVTSASTGNENGRYADPKIIARTEWMVPDSLTDQCLINVDTRDLGHLIWDYDIPDPETTDQPTIWLNKNIKNIAERFKEDNAFQASIVISFLHECYKNLTKTGEGDAPFKNRLTPSSWHKDFWDYAMQIDEESTIKIQDEPDESERIEWARNIVEKISIKCAYLEKINSDALSEVNEDIDG